MEQTIAKFLMGLTAGCGIAYLAYRAHALNRSGFLAASILGTIVFGLGGAGWAVILLTFFISSSALSRIFKAKKKPVGDDFAKGSRRDGWQVIANGGVAGILVLAYVIIGHIQPQSQLIPCLWLGFAASLAGANADTWGTELGILNPNRPVLISSFKQVPKGTSGAVSLVGSLAALAGSALVAGMAVWVAKIGWAPGIELPVTVQFLLITAAGLIGSLVDSLLGATLQAIYYCPRCAKETERHPKHVCGVETTLRHGLWWLNNDWVNGACTFSAGLVGVIFGMII